MKRKKTGLVIVILSIFVFGLAYFAQTFFIGREGKVAGEQAEVGKISLDELKRKIGPEVEYSIDRNTSQLTFMSAKKGEIPLPFKKLFSNDPTATAKYFMQEYGRYFGLEKPSRELLFVKKKEDERGMNHVLYNQEYKDVPVFGAQAVVHLKKDNSVSSASAKFLHGVSLETKPKISQKRAVREAEKYWEDWGNAGRPKTSKSKLFVFNKNLVEGRKSGASHLVWMVELIGEKGEGREYFFINARDGSFAYHLSGRRDTTRIIYDGNSGSYVLARLEGAGPTGTADVDNAYDLLSNVHSYFATKFGRNGANKQGGLGDNGYYLEYTDAEADVRVDNIPVYTPKCPNSFFNADIYGTYITFCDGTVVSDIFGHEYQHGASYFSILDADGQPYGLTYSGEPGALEEGYANIFGEAFEQFNLGSADWQTGEGSSLGTIFNFSDPGSINLGYGPYPAKTFDPGFYCGTGDNGGRNH
jgi:Zn-dependent metalloprotease